MGTLFLLAPFAAAVVALRTRDRLTAIVVLFAYLSVEGLLKLLTNYHPIVHVGTDIVLWILVGVWSAMAIVQRTTRLPRVPLFPLVAFHVLWIVLLAFSPYTASLYVGVASWKVHLSMIPLYVIGYLVAADPAAPRRFLRPLTIFWCGAFALTLVQYVTGPGAVLDLGEAYLARAAQFHEWRPFGTTALPGGEAVYAFFALPFALALVLRGDYRLRDPWIIATLAGAVTVFFVSGVRQAFLGSLVVIVTMVGLQLTRGRGRAASALVAAIVIGGGAYVIVREYLLPEAQRAMEEATGIPDIWRERSVVDRLGTLLDLDTYARARTGGLGLMRDRIVEFPFGAGLGRTGSAAAALRDQLARDPLGRMIQDRYGFQDNFFAAMLVETGVPGTVLLTTILIGVGVLALRVARRAPGADDAAFGALTAGFVAAMLVMSWGSQPLMANPTAAMFWFLGGMLGRRYHAMLEAHDERAASDAAAQRPAPAA